MLCLRFMLTFFCMIVYFQVHELQCLKCQEKYETLELLLGHMTTTTDHITIFIDDKSTWDQPE